MIAWVRQQPDSFDVDRCVAWGSSFGGMHVTALLAEDHQLAALCRRLRCLRQNSKQAGHGVKYKYIKQHKEVGT